MKKGFTLIELVVVIIVIGILATLGLTQYGKMIEKSRAAEAKMILGDIRKFAAAYRLEHGSITAITAADVNIGTGLDQIPSACHSAHYFSYALTSNTDPSLVVMATRCAALGKDPQGSASETVTLTSDLSTGVDTWTTAGGL